MVRGGGDSIARTAYSVVRGINRGHLSKLPLNITTSMTGSYQDGFLGKFERVYPDDSVGVEERLPKHYMDFHNQWKKGPQSSIHQIIPQEKWRKTDTGVVIPVQTPRIPVLYPDEFHKGLWGGQGVVKGLEEPEDRKHKPNYDIPQEKYWFPKLFVGVVYSEILNTHLEVTMTKRAQRLIDQSYGLDNYLLETPVNEVYSLLALKIKRQILLALSGGKLPDAVMTRYSQYIVPHEVADWHGLPWNDALDKLHEIERIQDKSEVKPLKVQYRQELLELLEKGQMDEVDPNVVEDLSVDGSSSSSAEGGWLDKIGKTFSGESKK